MISETLLALLALFEYTVELFHPIAFIFPNFNILNLNSTIQPAPRKQNCIENLNRYDWFNQIWANLKNYNCQKTFLIFTVFQLCSNQVWFLKPGSSWSYIFASFETTDIAETGSIHPVLGSHFFWIKCMNQISMSMFISDQSIWKSTWAKELVRNTNLHKGNISVFFFETQNEWNCHNLNLQ